MEFEEAYELFIQQHLKTRKGEAKRRLREGHGHADKLFIEKVWWPVFGHFDGLQPEFEVQDFQDGFRYLDFAFLRGIFRFCFEIDGYGPHCRDLNRRQFSDQLIRQNHLVLDGWIVLRFSYDDIRDHPRQCQQMLQQMMGRWFAESIPGLNLTISEKEIIRLARISSKPLTPGDFSLHLGICRRNAQKQLYHLVDKQVFAPIATGTSKRIRSYRIKANRVEIFV